MLVLSQQSDMLYAVLCAAGFNIRRLMRAIAAQAARAAKAFFWGLFCLVNLLQMLLGGQPAGFHCARAVGPWKAKMLRRSGLMSGRVKGLPFARRDEFRKVD